MLTKLATVGLVAFFSLSPPMEQDVASLKREIDALKAQQAAMQRDLDAIKAFLQQLLRQPQDNKLVDASVVIAGEPAKGSPSAKVTMVEVSDYHCPFCRRHTLNTQPQIDAGYINTGKVRYVFLDYPIDQLHPEAFRAHEGANCAGDQGKYWEMHATLFAAPPAREAGQLAVDWPRRREVSLVPRRRQVLQARPRERGPDAGARRGQHPDVPPRPDTGARPALEGAQGRQGRAAVRGLQGRDRFPPAVGPRFSAGVRIRHAGAASPDETATP
jgi:hypothetical protein